MTDDRAACLDSCYGQVLGPVTQNIEARIGGWLDTIKAGAISVLLMAIMQELPKQNLMQGGFEVNIEKAPRYQQTLYGASPSPIHPASHTGRPDRLHPLDGHALVFGKSVSNLPGSLNMTGNNPAPGQPRSSEQLQGPYLCTRFAISCLILGRLFYFRRPIIRPLALMFTWTRVQLIVIPVTRYTSISLRMYQPYCPTMIVNKRPAITQELGWKRLLAHVDIDSPRLHMATVAAKHSHPFPHACLPILIIVSS
jgi:hypothetical protein